jgi:hypothetical protein
MSSLTDAITQPITAYFDYAGTDQAINAQRGALKRLQEIKPDDANALAQKFDIERYKKGFSTQEENDPLYAKLREQGAQSILDSLLQDASGNTVGDQSLSKLSAESDANDKQLQPFIQTLFDKAKAELDAGATLPPEFQAELVKAGLERAGTAGNNLDGSASAGTNVRRLLGSEGLALSNQRTAMGANILDAAQKLRESRANILTNLITLDNNLRNAKAARGGAAATLGNSTIPGIGLTGADAANIHAGNIDQRNKVTMAKGQLSALARLNENQMISNEVKAGTNLVATVASMFMGGGLGGMGGGMGGMMGGAGGAAGGAGGGTGLNFLSGFMSPQGVGGGSGGSTANGTGTTNGINWSFLNGLLNKQ